MPTKSGLGNDCEFWTAEGSRTRSATSIDAFPQPHSVGQPDLSLRETRDAVAELTGAVLQI